VHSLGLCRNSWKVVDWRFWMILRDYTDSICTPTPWFLLLKLLRHKMSLGNDYFISELLKYCFVPKNTCRRGWLAVNLTELSTCISNILAWVIICPQQAISLHGTYHLYHVPLWFAWYINPSPRAAGSRVWVYISGKWYSHCLHFFSGFSLSLFH